MVSLPDGGASFNICIPQAPDGDDAVDATTGDSATPTEAGANEGGAVADGATGG
jgi:hypothetical protein